MELTNSLESAGAGSTGEAQFGYIIHLPSSFNQKVEMIYVQ